MSIKLIGAGFGRTGTLSLKNALEQIGFGKCYHMLEVYQNDGHRDEWVKAARGEAIDWVALFDGYQSSCDWPSCNFWREQLEVWPDAKVILTQRDPERWYTSVMNTIWQSSSEAASSDDPTIRAGADMAFEVIWDPIFDRRMDDKQHVIDCYLAHNQQVRDAVPADRLLEFDPAMGWEPLCAFTGVEVPDTPYPSVNSTAQFQERRAAMRKESS